MKTTTDLSSLKQNSIPVSRVEQLERMWCGPAVLQSVMNYLGDDSTQEDIAKTFDVRSGCFIQQLGQYALERGFGASIYSYDVMCLDPSWGGLDHDALLDRLRRAMGHRSLGAVTRQNYSTLIKFMSSGGKLSVALPGKEMLASFVNSGKPVIALVNSNALYDRPRLNRKGEHDDILGNAGGHFVIVTGHSNGFFTIVDPNYDRPLNLVAEDRFLFALSIWGGWVLVLHEKKE